MEPYLSDVLLILQVLLLFVVLRIYFVAPSRTSGLLLAALICYAIAGSSWFTVHFTAGVMGSETSESQERILESTRHYVDVGFQIIFVLLMIAALSSYRKRSTASATPTI